MIIDQIVGRGCWKSSFQLSVFSGNLKELEMTRLLLFAFCVLFSINDSIQPNMKISAKIRCSSGSRLNELFPASPSCSCEICRGYCRRPGWWTVPEAGLAIRKGLSHRMMLEISPEVTFGVLSPAFRGCEMHLAANAFKNAGCTFFHENGCELYQSGMMPLECRFCHHDRIGSGQPCHTAIENDWNSIAGRKLVVEWSNLTRLWERLALQ